jgi:hypothetical protein
VISRLLSEGLRRTGNPQQCAAQPGMVVNRFVREIVGILNASAGAFVATECHIVG